MNPPMRPLFHVPVCLSGLLLSAALLGAQPVDRNGVLQADAANDYYQRGKNLYDEASRIQDPAQRQRLFLSAIEILDSYLVDFPGHENAPKAWWHLGSAYQQIGRPKDARRYYSALIQRHQKGPWVAAAAYALAAEHYNNKEYAVAAPLFERYGSETLKPGEQARGYYYAGHCYRLSGLDREASAAFHKVVEEPEAGEFTVLAKLGLAHVESKLGRDDKALEGFEEIIGLECADPVKAEALLHAALTARKLEKPEPAIAYLDRILATKGMESWWPSAHAALMTSYFEQEDFNKVVEMGVQAGFPLQGEREAARQLLVGRAMMRLEKSEDAMAVFRAVERMVPPESDLAFQASYYRLMCFYRVEGKHVPEQVDAFLDLYRGTRPNDLRIHTALMMKAESLHAEGKLAAAAQVYNQVDESRVSDANRPGLLYQRGWCLAAAGDQAGALRSLDQFIRDHPEDSRVASALAKRAKVHEQAGQDGRAMADYDRLIKLGEPADMVTLAWLESARLRRGAKQIEDMIVRYQGLLDEVKDLEPKLAAEANYWIGWGLVKTNQPKKSIGPLEKARQIRADLYGKHAGLLLALGYFADQNITKLAQEVHLAIKGGYQEDLPDQAIQWVGMQSYNAGSFEDAATFLALIANAEEPRETPMVVWRYLGKALLETGDAQAALPAIHHVLEVEKRAAWQADGLLDQGKALYLLKRYADCRASVDKALALQPQGRTRGNLRILAGDLDMQAGDAKKASAQYLIVVSFINDEQLKPLALHKLIAAQQALGEQAEADKYREQLQSEFPDWKAP